MRAMSLKALKRHPRPALPGVHKSVQNQKSLTSNLANVALLLTNRATFPTLVQHCVILTNSEFSCRIVPIWSTILIAYRRDKIVTFRSTPFILWDCLVFTDVNCTKNSRFRSFFTIRSAQSDLFVRIHFEQGRVPSQRTLSRKQLLHAWPFVALGSFAEGTLASVRV